MELREPRVFPRGASGNPKPSSPAHRAAGARAWRLWRAATYDPQCELAQGHDPWSGGARG